jgi:hypothetical protein
MAFRGDNDNGYGGANASSRCTERRLYATMEVRAFMMAGVVVDVGLMNTYPIAIKNTTITL